MSAPLFACERPRFASGALELGELEVHGRRLALVGAWEPLFRALTGEQPLAGGEIHIAGQSAVAAVRSGGVGLHVVDAPLPDRWSARDVLANGAELLGLVGRRAVRHGVEVARALGIDAALLARPLARLATGERRAVELALASLGEPRAFVLEQPFLGLEPSGEEYVGRVLERMLALAPIVFSAAALPACPVLDALVQSSDAVLIATATGAVVQGKPAAPGSGAPAYRVVVSRHSESLLNRLGEAGYDAQRVMADEIAALIVRDIGARGTEPLLEAAVAADAPILELCIERPELAEHRALSAGA